MVFTTFLLPWFVATCGPDKWKTTSSICKKGAKQMVFTTFLLPWFVATCGPDTLRTSTFSLAVAMARIRVIMLLRP
jgi:hypothetical protein